MSVYHHVINCIKRFFEITHQNSDQIYFEVIHFRVNATLNNLVAASSGSKIKAICLKKQTDRFLKTSSAL